MLDAIGIGTPEAEDFQFSEFTLAPGNGCNLRGADV